LDGFKVYWRCLWFESDTRIIIRVPGGAPSLWLGFLFVKCSRLTGFCVVAWLCSVCCQATFKLLRIWLTKGFKGPFVILRAHSCVWMGSMLYKAFCLVYHGSHPNNCEHKCIHEFSQFTILYLTSIPGGWRRCISEVDVANDWLAKLKVTFSKCHFPNLTEKKDDLNQRFPTWVTRSPRDRWEIWRFAPKV